MDFKEMRDLFHIDGNIGFDKNEISRAVQLWGSLPSVLQEYYRQLGKHERLNRSQNFLLRPSELMDLGQYVAFYIENQDCVDWCIRKDDLAKDNPPVYCRTYNNEFALESETLTDFLNGMALFQAGSWGMTYASEDLYTITEAQAEKIRQKYQKKKYELSQWIHMSFYGNSRDEVILLMDNDDYDMTYGAEDEGRFEEMKKVMEEMGVEAY